MTVSLRRIALLSVLLMASCTRALDNMVVEAELAKPVQRFDTFLAAASNDQRVLIAGGNNVIVTSADDGKTWVREQLPSPSSIVAMSSCPDGGFAALDFYHKVWIGDLRGRNWESRRVDGNFNPLNIACDPHNRLWVVGSFSTILHSSDRGQSWQSQPPGPDAILTALQWIDAEHGLIAGEFGTLLVSSDSGLTWSRQAGLPAEFYPYSMLFANATNGWMSSQAGTILHTGDGGKSWSPQANGPATPVYAFIAIGARLFGVGGANQILELEGDQWASGTNVPSLPGYAWAAAHVGPHSMLVAGPAGALKVIDAFGGVRQ
jgi:photosystem II stability/assembly factor-like uncharacterized protein